MILMKIAGSHVKATLGAGVLEPSRDSGANCILAQALVENVRFTMDASTEPTASLGFVLTAGDPPTLIPVYKTTDIKFFRESAGAILEYQWGIADQ